ncbi:hypothetical protein TTRE_0000596201 [Trichuris trichiura]|uniref:Uncharacterized protein n=1 Tax=Trichuris trichiura TaxID=36087 RepID=A0A077ZCX9_TRITR|nr:hypothetical protein TTRE_0000596201 [Trichuris trichiura]
MYDMRMNTLREIYFGFLLANSELLKEAGRPCSREAFQHETNLSVVVSRLEKLLVRGARWISTCGPIGAKDMLVCSTRRCWITAMYNRKLAVNELVPIVLPQRQSKRFRRTYVDKQVSLNGLPSMESLGDFVPVDAQRPAGGWLLGEAVGTWCPCTIWTWTP